METNKLAIKQLDKKLEEWGQSKAWFQPKNGWVKTIRKAIGMTANQLASRLGVNRSRVIKIESDENRAALTMKTLAATADALNCDLVYAFVPRKPLQKIIEQQAYNVAVRQIKNISHSMALEKQSLTSEQNSEQVEELKAKLLKKSSKTLWSEK